MFEFQGIPCRHLLFVLRNIGINDLPAIYILKRWCKYAKKGVVIDNSGKEIIVNSHDPKSTLFREVRHNSDRLAQLGSTSKENVELMSKLIKKTIDEFKALSCTPNEDNHNNNEGGNEVDRASCTVESISITNQVLLVNEPSHCCPKGCGKRLKY